MTDKQELETIEKYIENTDIPTQEELIKTNSVTLEEINGAFNDFYQRRGIILSEEYLLEEAKKIINISSLQTHEIIGKSKIVDILVKDNEKEEYVLTTKKVLSPLRQIKISKDIIGYHLASPIDYPLKEAIPFLNNNLESFQKLMELYRQIQVFKEYNQLPLYLEINPIPELDHYLSIDEEGLEIQRRNYELDTYENSVIDILYNEANQDIQEEYLKRVTIPLSSIQECEGRNIIKKYVKR